MLELGVSYEVHVQNIGWMPAEANGVLAGTTGQGLRIEAFRVKLINPKGYNIQLHANAHVQNIGWMGFVGEGEICGTTGKGLQIEGIQLSLVGSDADKFDVNFRTHCQDLGDLNWAVDGELSGSEGGGLRVEALAIIIVPQGVDLGINGIESFKHIEKKTIEELTPIVTEDDVYGIYFDAYEFACDCVKGYDIPDPCDGWPETSFGKNPNLNSDFLNVIKQIRADLQKAIVITCATRCRSCNTYWGGVWDSLHLEGIAIDCYCPEMDVVDFAFFIWNNYGIPCRVYPSQGFVHVELSSLGGVFNQEKYYFM